MEKTQEQRSEEIFLKIEEIYQRKSKDGKPVGKNFVTHLLRAYFPVGKAQRVIDVPEKLMKCAITGQSLFAVGELWNSIQEDKDFFKNMTKSMFSHIDPEAEKVDSPIAKIANGRVIGITGENTDTYLCQESYEGLFNWYANKILHGDKHISWVIHDMRRKNTITSIREKLPAAEDQKKIDRIEKISKHPERATMSLGDLSVLQELQAKLKQQEENDKK